MSRRKAAQTARRRHAARRRQLLIGGGLAIAVIAAFFLVRPLLAETGTSAASDPSVVAAHTAPVRGNANAPVSIVE